MKNTALLLLLIAGSIFSLSVSEESISAPNGIARLKNGKYLACVNKKQPNIYDESQTCFSFGKQGNRITGGYEVSQEGPIVCVTGTVKNNVIIGSAYDDSINSAANGVTFNDIEDVRRNLPKSKPIYLATYLQVADGKLSVLKVGKNVKTKPLDFEAKITYGRAKLDLSKFQYISRLRNEVYDCLEK
jgi:hypothetical protein